jgi:hypothetical protein
LKKEMAGKDIATKKGLVGIVLAAGYGTRLQQDLEKDTTK